MLRAAVIDAARYPYTVDLESYVRRRFGPVSYHVVMLRKEVVERAFERLRQALREGRIAPHSDPDVEVPAFYLGLLLAALTGDRWAVSRYALAEAEKSHELLKDEDDEVVVSVARAVGVKLRYDSRGLRVAYAVTSTGITLYHEYHYALSIFEYARLARRLLGDPAWKTSNLPVKNGLVYLEKGQVVRILKEAIMEHVERLATQVREAAVGEKLPDELVRLVEEAKRVIAESRPKPKVLKEGGRIRVRVPKGVIIEEAFPPCMADILERARRGEHLSHHERFAIATFLLNLGMDIDRVVDVFRNMPDFNEKIARYQVEHLAGLRGSGKRYRTYSCEKMRSLGLCKGECGTRNPIQAYYRNLSRLAKEGKLKLEAISGGGSAASEGSSRVGEEGEEAGSGADGDQG